MIYFPVARTLDKDNNEITLSVYVGYVNKESALKQFELWSEGYGYELEDCRIDCFDSYEMVDCLKVERHFLIITDTPQTDCPWK